MIKPTLTQLLDKVRLPKHFKQEMYKMNLHQIAYVAMNKKNKNNYFVLKLVIDCTNSTEGRVMVLYSNEEQNEFFVREITEFYDKFMLMEQ